MYLQKNETNQKLNEAVRASTERREAVSTTHAAGQIPVTIKATRRLAGFKRCPAPTTFYTGREEENSQVIACITGGKDERRICVIHGLGGMGKTQLALNVIERTWDEWDYVIYVDASSNEAIEKTLKEFGESREIGQSYTDVISWLESCGERWLVFFDNADTQSTRVRQYIPARGRNSIVIITTRLPDLAKLAAGSGSVCHVSSMNPADAVTLLIKIACSGNQCISDKDTEAAEELAQDFGYLALAIVHAGAFIAHSPSMTVAKYRSLFLSQRQRMLEQYEQLPELAKLDERGDTVYTTWRMCYDQLKPESRELLWLIAYMHYDGISEEIFERAANNLDSKAYPLPLTDLETQARERVQKYLSTFRGSDKSWDIVKFIAVMADLTSYSLIDFDRMSFTYRIHVLVHDWARTIVPHSPELAVECTATILSLSIDQGQDAETLAFKRQLGLHVTSVLTNGSNLGANHVNYFKEVYLCTGQWIQKAKLEQKLSETFQHELGSNHVQTWSALCGLASTYLESGQWDKALELQTRVVDAYRRILGEEHSNTLASINNLALTHSHLGRHKEAEQLQLQVLAVQKRVLGEEHLFTLTSTGNLAMSYSCLGRHNEAEQLQARVLDIRKCVLGNEHPDTLTSMSNLASTYSYLGRHSEAEQLQVQVLDIRRRVMGSEHPHTLTSMSNLALTYSDLGQYNEAEQLQVRVLDIRKRVLGEEHPSTLTFMSNLAMTYSHLGRHDEAGQLEVQVLDIRKRVLGEEHPDTLRSMDNLAWIYSNLSQWDEAEEVYHRAIGIAKRTLGNLHPDTQLYGQNFEWMQTRRNTELQQVTQPIPKTT
ncbi:unnamed protein product [Rhizoctonia solani]|uniref:NB-ARC domain-containing protein n=1 Tax=Rhizoctonia solani TaxID=456999 RepID=A0A8H3E6U2_9AGAM|nr:unnamed protein product [Rhizoctonia solani]